MIIAPEQFRDEEFREPKTIFESNQISITVASTRTGLAIGKLGMQVMVDELLSNVHVDTFDGIVYIGGPGVKNLWDNPDARKLARQFYESGKLVTAICSAPVILAREGLLKGIKATSFQGDQAEMEQAGVMYTGELVTQELPFITANGPQAATSFGEAIVRALIH